jgi:putative peptidoglycan lipid II flippase
MDTLGRVFLAALGAAAVGVFVVAVLPGGDTPGRVEAVLQLAIGGVAVGVTYLALATLLRIREIGDVVALVRRRFRR